MKKLTALLLALVMALSLVACGGSDAPAATEAPKAEAPAATEAPAAEAPAAKTAADLKLGFILGSREHAFYCSIEEGIMAAAAELGFEAVVLESDLDGAIASERIETLVVDGCDAISLSVNDPSASTPAIVAAHEDGTPMFAFDCTSTETDVIKCFVGTDNYQGGVVGGEATINYLKEAGLKDVTIAVIPDKPQSCIDRRDGWLSYVEQYKDELGLEIVVLSDYAGDATTAEGIMNDALIAYPNLKCIFTSGDPACIGALAAIKNAGSDCKMIGFDANPEAHEAILDPVNGQIWFADVAQDPYKIGYDIAHEMVSYCIDGTVSAPVSLVAPYLVDASNAVAP